MTATTTLNTLTSGTWAIDPTHTEVGVATDPWGNDKAAFEATADINRTDWGLTWNANLEKGGVLVSEKIKLVLDVQLAKQA